MKSTSVLSLAALCLMMNAFGASGLRAQSFPEFQVPGFEIEMQALNALHIKHHERAFSDCTLWDGWLPHLTLHDVWAIQNFKLQTVSSTEGWEIAGGKTLGVTPADG